MDITEILKTGGLRPSHFDDGDCFDGEPEDEFTIVGVNSSSKTALIVAQTNRIDTFEAAVLVMINAAKAAKDTTVDNFESANDSLLSGAITDIHNYIDANSSEDTVTVGATTLKAQIESIINALAIDYATHKANLATDIDNVNPDYETLKDDLESDVNSNISDDAVGSKVAVFAEAKAQLQAAIQAHEVEGETVYNFPCTRCKTTGRLTANQEPNSNPDDTRKIPCPSCDQLEYTEVENIPFGLRWSAINEF